MGIPKTQWMQVPPAYHMLWQQISAIEIRQKPRGRRKEWMDLAYISTNWYKTEMHVQFQKT